MKTIKIQFKELPEFEKDFKKLLKRYRTLNEDLDILRKILNDEPNELPPFSFQIEGLGIDTCLIKVKKIACKSLKGRGVNSGLRLIYAYFKDKPEIIFVELYHKSDKESEDRDRIMKHYKFL
jgi:mRNA-degrading endonuclease RelE of RelBE toxin-antitoxin system